MKYDVKGWIFYLLGFTRLSERHVGIKWIAQRMFVRLKSCQQLLVDPKRLLAILFKLICDGSCSSTISLDRLRSHVVIDYDCT
jgi:hypothetical protein